MRIVPVVTKFPEKVRKKSTSKFEKKKQIMHKRCSFTSSVVKNKTIFVKIEKKITMQYLDYWKYSEKIVDAEGR